MGSLDLGSKPVEIIQEARLVEVVEQGEIRAGGKEAAHRRGDDDDRAVVCLGLVECRCEASDDGLAEGVRWWA